MGRVTPLFERVLGAAWPALPAAIRDLHTVTESRVWHGRATVERGSTLLGRLAATVARLPAPGDAVAVEVRLEPLAAGERWTRTFAGKSFASRLFQPSPAMPGHIAEGFGPVAFLFKLAPDGNRLRLTPFAWRILGMPMPGALNPVGDSYEFVDGAGRFNFHVEVVHPWFGLIVRYRGYLVPRDTQAAAAKSGEA